MLLLGVRYYKGSHLGGIVPGETKVKSQTKNSRERHYTWTGGKFPKPDTSAIDFYTGATTEYVGGDTRIVRVNDVQLWRQVHDRAMEAVVFAVGGTGAIRIKK